MKDEQSGYRSKIVLDDEEYLVVLIPDREDLAAYDKKNQKGLETDEDAGSWFEIAHRLALKMQSA